MEAFMSAFLDKIIMKSSPSLMSYQTLMKIAEIKFFSIGKDMLYIIIALHI